MPVGTPDPNKPLRPLTPHARDMLREIARRPHGLERYRVNPGVASRLFREDLIRQEGQRYVATDAGLAEAKR